MSDLLTVPWQALEQFAREHGAGQAILVAWKDGAGYCVVTWGESELESARAADGGNWIKRCLGYPDEMCSAVPKKLDARLIGPEDAAVLEAMAALDIGVLEYIEKGWSASHPMWHPPALAELAKRRAAKAGTPEEGQGG